MIGDKAFDTTFERLSDGREIKETYPDGPAVSCLRWDRDALLFTDKQQMLNGEVIISFRYELSQGGRRIRAVERIRGAGRDQENLWIFDRADNDTAGQLV